MIALGLPDWISECFGGTWVFANPFWVSVVSITPETASKLLDNHNLKNRQVKPKNVARLETAIKENQWELTGQPIIIGLDDQIKDGQHRLQACVAAKKPIAVLIVYGAPDSVFTKIDTGVKRSRQDALHIKGIASSTRISPMIAMYHHFLRSGEVWNSSNYALNNDESLSFVRPYLDGFQSSLGYIRRFQTDIVRQAGSFSLLSVLHYIFSQVRPDMANAMFSALLDANIPQDVSQWSAVRELHHMIISRKLPAHYRIISALYIKAWNTLLGEKKRRTLRFSPEYEHYPQVSGWSYRDNVPMCVDHKSSQLLMEEPGNDPYEVE